MNKIHLVNMTNSPVQIIISNLCDTPIQNEQLQSNCSINISPDTKSYNIKVCTTSGHCSLPININNFKCGNIVYSNGVLQLFQMTNCQVFDNKSFKYK